MLPDQNDLPFATVTTERGSMVNIGKLAKEEI